VAEVSATLAEQWVIPVIRSREPEDAYATARALGEAGLRWIELTMTVPDVFEVVSRLADTGLRIGVGTISAVDDVRRTADAGGSFAVSFHRPHDFLAVAADVGLLAIPGALTPQEIAQAKEAGATWVKIFPAHVVGSGYLADIRTVLPGLRLLPTGGIEPSTNSLRKWRNAGADAVGIGRALGTVAEYDSAEVTRRGLVTVTAVEEARADQHGN
jgi:2-dehydro-3-deoxyphosphogluconate aldolase/(4S)-4-hydroxy-2-oxoglutarate aldolase